MDARRAGVSRFTIAFHLSVAAGSVPFESYLLSGFQKSCCLLRTPSFTRAIYNNPARDEDASPRECESHLVSPCKQHRKERKSVCDDEYSSKAAAKHSEKRVCVRGLPQIQREIGCPMLY